MTDEVKEEVKDPTEASWTLTTTGFPGDLKITSIVKWTTEDACSWSVGEKVQAMDGCGFPVTEGTKGVIVDLRSPISHHCFVGVLFEGVSVVRWQRTASIQPDLSTPIPKDQPSNEVRVV